MNSKQVLTLAAGLALSGLAFAHVGHHDIGHHGFAEGISHPFTGLDHLAAMLAVGIWSAGTPRRQWLAPLVFTLMLLAGALLAQSGLHFPAVEPMIAGSLLVVGALLMSPQQLPVAAAALAMGGFALFHGAAHGQELSGTGALAGMVLGTALLHGLGIGLGLALRKGSLWLPRLSGAAVALFGMGLLT
ncbi:HupE/UreJ family protein [Paucibacter sp. O1-1]|nr:HupE/UreJ family protein [Paucibacter sp. O1-1]MDA3826949.1 HupE/UreJ family protein [Paucibacter sp. O1-1]